MVYITFGACMEAPLKATVWIGGVIVRGAAAATLRSSRHPALCADLSLAHTSFMWSEKAEGEVTAVCAECVLKDSFTEGHSLCKLLWSELYNDVSGMASDFSALYVYVLPVPVECWPTARGGRPRNNSWNCHIHIAQKFHSNGFALPGCHTVFRGDL